MLVKCIYMGQGFCKVAGKIVYLFIILNFKLFNFFSYKNGSALDIPIIFKKKQQ